MAIRMKYVTWQMITGPEIKSEFSDAIKSDFSDAIKKYKKISKKINIFFIELLH